MKEETVITTAKISSQGQIKIKKALTPFLPWQPGDLVEFVLKEKDIIIRNTHKKA
jgi:bifunctional DNA-binding transcriptional regulator/antitoxin component of YhaV-PrlF toxin-antitoxin module